MAGLPVKSAWVKVGTAVILQWAKHRIGIDLVARRCQNTAAIIVAEVVAERGERTARVDDVCSPKSPVSRMVFPIVTVPPPL